MVCSTMEKTDDSHASGGHWVKVEWKNKNVVEN